MRVSLTRWIARVALLGVNLLLAACSTPVVRPPSDAVFQEMVLEVMPG